MSGKSVVSGGCEMTKIDYLFRSIQLGHLTLPNHVVMTTVKLGYSYQEIYVIGDAVEPRKALDAIYEGFKIGILV